MGVQIARCEGATFRGKDVPDHAQWHSAVNCAKTAELIKMPFGLWTHGSMCYRGCTLAQPGKYDWTVHVWRRWGLCVKLFWPIIIIIIMNELYWPWCQNFVTVHSWLLITTGIAWRSEVNVFSGVRLFVCQHDNFRTIKRRMTTLGG